LRIALIVVYFNYLFMVSGFMKIVIFRHGEAEERKPGQGDEERRLTEKGRRDVEVVARALPWKPSKIYTSPLLRAVETAKIIASIHGVDVVVTDYLRPGQISVENLLKLGVVDSAVLVGHAPSIESLVSELIGGGNIKLKAGSAVGIELTNICRGCGALIFILIPDALHKLISANV
jgi:phosphohistidine phosphatase